MRQGFTLIEVIISLGIMAIVLPATTLFLLQLLEEQGGAQTELQMEQAASLVLSELRTELTEATVVNVSGSVLGDDNGVLVFVDAQGETVTIDRPTFGNGRRLRFQRGLDPVVYLTSSGVDVVSFRLDALREATTDTLTGLRLTLDLQMINPTATAFRQITFSRETSIALSPQTTEL